MSGLRIAATGAMFLFPVLAHAGDLRADANAVFKPIDPASVNSVVRNNAITPAKIELGHKLFFDPRLSKSQIISCNTRAASTPARRRLVTTGRRARVARRAFSTRSSTSPSSGMVVRLT